MKWLVILILIVSSLAQAKTPVIVAVVDMGIDNKLIKINDYLVPGWDFGENQKSMGVDYNDIYTKEFHGTLVAGLIARKVSPSKIKIMDLVYMDYEGKKFKLNEYIFAENMLQLYRRKKAYERFTEHLRDVFRYAKENNAQVINFSSSDARFYGEELKLWIKDNPETIVVVSAGNDGSDLDKFPQYPCLYKDVICVGAVNLSKRTTYSNYGSGITLYAQGDYSNEVKGTSFSAPVISQAVALIKYQNPDWSFDQVRSELIKYTKNKNGIKVFQHRKFLSIYNK